MKSGVHSLDDHKDGNHCHVGINLPKLEFFVGWLFKFGTSHVRHKKVLRPDAFLLDARRRNVDVIVVADGNAAAGPGRPAQVVKVPAQFFYLKK